MIVDTKKLRELAAAATPGPWQWFGSMRMREVYLATIDRGREIVMDFERWGMNSAQPRFQVRRGDLGIMQKFAELEGADEPRFVESGRSRFAGIGHPDAAYIAAADPTTVIALIDELEQLRRELQLYRRPNIVPLTIDNCNHNREVDPESGVCADCGTVCP